MGGLIGAIIQKIVETFFEKGLDTAASHTTRNVRRVITLFAALAAGWIGFASAFLWMSPHYPDEPGFVAVVQAGGPVWVLALPTVAAITVIWLLIPLKGRHGITFWLIFAVFFLTLVELYWYQGFEIGLAGLFSFLASLLLVIFALILVYGDPPSLDSPLARLSFDYWGRLRHLRALRRYARQLNWSFSGPSGRYGAYTAEGTYDHDHPVTVTSSAQFSAVGGTPTYTLSVKMGSPRDIIAFRISWEQPSKKLKGQVLAGVTRGMSGQRKRAIHYYLAPHPDYPIPDGLLQDMGQLIERGRSYFKAKDFARAAPFGIRYTHLRIAFGLTIRDAQLDPLLAWMHELVALLEPVSPDPAPVQAGARSSFEQ